MKYRILMLGPDPGSKGGVSSVVRGYLNSRLTELCDVTYIVTHADGKFWQKLCRAVGAFFRTTGCLFRVPVDVVHIHMASRASFYRKFFFFFLAKAFRKRIVVHLHGAEFNVFYHRESLPVLRCLIRQVLKRADKVIALSKRWREDIVKITGGADNVVVIPNAVALNAPEAADDSVSANVLFMGDFGPRKGVYDIIEAAPEIVRRYPQVMFHLCGTGDIDHVKQMIRDRGVEEHFCVPGWVEKTDGYYRNAQIYVLPSYNEGLPMSLLEAASYGLPLISTPVGGIPEIIDDGVNGFLVPPGNVSVLSDRLMRLIQSPELRRRFGARGREIIAERFAIDTIVDELIALYSLLTGQQTKGAS